MRLPLPIESTRRSSPERLINCFVETKPQDAKSPVALVRAAGITRLSDLRFRGRGLHIFAGYLWAVVAGRLLRIDTDTGEIRLTGYIPGFDRVQIASTVDRLCVVADSKAYLADEDGNVTQITDDDFRRSSSVDFLDNYLLFVESASGRFFSSNLNAPETYDNLNFATAESNPDNLIGLIADHGQVFLAGTDSCELWANVGGDGFPFARISNGMIELGCAAGQSLAKLDNSVFWLASDLTVRRLSGLTPKRISTPGVEYALQGYGNIENAYGLSYTFDGHLMYALTVPGFGTWEYDATTQKWHERESYGAAHWQVVGIAQVGRNVFALHEDGRLGLMQVGRYTEFGDTQVVSWTNQPIYAEGERTSLAEVELMVRSQ